MNDQVEESTEARPELPPQAVLYRLAIGHYVSRALALAAKLGIADLLAARPRDAGDLAAATETQAGALRRVLRLLVSVGVLAEDEGGRFGLTPLGDCLRADAPGSARAAVLLFAGDRVQDAWKELEYCVRTGEPAFRKRGVTDPFAEMAARPEDAANFDTAMAEFTRLTAVAVAAAYDFSSLRTIVDVGGGNGALLIGILSSHLHLEGIVFEQPHVAERAAREIERNGLADRCRVVGGDFFAAVPEGGDAYLLKHVIHDWDDDHAITILRNCHRAMGPNGRLLVVEGVYPERIDESFASRGAAANDVNMLVSTGGRQRSEAEFRELYEQAGFTLERIVPTAMASVIEGAHS
jgi:orsellinic acid C2-O-methyltransferase